MLAFFVEIKSINTNMKLKNISLKKSVCMYQNYTFPLEEISRIMFK